MLVFEPFTTCQRVLGASLTAKLALLAGKTRHHAARPRLSIVRKALLARAASLSMRPLCCCCSDILVWQGLVLFHDDNRRFDAALRSFQAAAAAGHAPSHFAVFTYQSETRPGVAFDACGAFAAAQSGAACSRMYCVAALAF